jgi:hypothetical protein
MAAFYVYRPVCSIMKCRTTEKNCRQGGLEGGLTARCAKLKLSGRWPPEWTCQGVTEAIWRRGG